MDWFKKQAVFNWHFNNGPFVEVLEGTGPYKVQFLHQGQLVYADWLEQGQWVRANRQYYTDWSIEILDHRRRRIFHHPFDLAGKRVRINFDSKSLGDTLAWLPQAKRFAEIHANTEIYLSQFWPSLFNPDDYPMLNFIKPDQALADCYATYKIGYFFDDLVNTHPVDPRLRPLGQVAADILGIAYQETVPAVVQQDSACEIPANPYVTLAMASTAECKHWLYPDGWQTVVNWLRQQGLEILVIQKEACNLEHVINATGDQDIADRIAQIRGSELFIGLGSGLSWLAWACRKPVVLISGFSQPFTEFQQRCQRVINQQACHGCWNDTAHAFDRGDWNWCPRHQGTERIHECSRLITPQMVIEAIRAALKSEEIKLRASDPGDQGVSQSLE